MWAGVSCCIIPETFHACICSLQIICCKSDNGCDNDNDNDDPPLDCRARASSIVFSISPDIAMRIMWMRRKLLVMMVLMMVMMVVMKMVMVISRGQGATWHTCPSDLSPWWRHNDTPNQHRYYHQMLSSKVWPNCIGILWVYQLHDGVQITKTKYWFCCSYSE